MNELTSNLLYYLIAPIVGLMLILLQRGKAKGYSARDVATSLVSLGIFGTFVGIAVSLYFFDVTNIQRSVPFLLDGMKTAFVTSVFGMGLAIWVRWRDMDKRSGKGQTSGATADDVCNILNTIHSSISGESDATLVNQVMLLRQESKDNHTKLVNAFESFAETMAESNSKALIQALEEVIRDFNAKINEQFGENFKELNSAVGKLLDWQENYKTQLEDMHNALKTAVTALQESEKALSTITERAEVFRETAEQLAEILQGYKRSQEDLEAKLNGFKALAEEAAQAFPIIKESVENLTETFGKAIEDSSEKTTEMFNQHQTILDQIEEMFSQANSTMEEFRGTMQESIQQTREQLRGLIDQQGEDMKVNMKQLDDDLGEELTKVLQTLGNQLATLSNKFVQDYTPLTDQLRNLVELSRRVQ